MDAEGYMFFRAPLHCCMHEPGQLCLGEYVSVLVECPPNNDIPIRLPPFEYSGCASRPNIDSESDFIDFFDASQSDEQVDIRRETLLS